MRHATVAYKATPAAFKHEKFDCGVRALRVAAGRTYEDTHRLLEAHGRVEKRGVYNHVMRGACAAFGLSPVGCFAGRLPSSATGKTHAPTLVQFVAAHPSGRYVLRVNTHFLALVDGVVHDWTKTRTGARTRVLLAWGR